VSPHTCRAVGWSGHDAAAARLPASAAAEVLCICFRTLCVSSTHACCLLCGRQHGCQWVIAEW